MGSLDGRVAWLEARRVARARRLCVFSHPEYEPEFDEFGNLVFNAAAYNAAIESLRPLDAEEVQSGEA